MLMETIDKSFRCSSRGCADSQMEKNLAITRMSKKNSDICINLSGAYMKVGSRMVFLMQQSSGALTLCKNPYTSPILVFLFRNDLRRYHTVTYVFLDYISL